MRVSSKVREAVRIRRVDADDHALGRRLGGGLCGAGEHGDGNGEQGGEAHQLTPTAVHACCTARNAALESPNSSEAARSVAWRAWAKVALGVR